MASAKGGLLARSDFPLYAVKALDERHFLVAGGGGAAKTGIANAIVRNFEFCITFNSLNCYCSMDAVWFEFPLMVHITHGHPTWQKNRHAFHCSESQFPL